MNMIDRERRRDNGSTGMETSKKILLYCDVLVSVAVICMVIATCMGAEAGPLSDVAVALVGLAAAAHSFYYWKAKCENMNKYKRRDGIVMDLGEGD